MAPDAMPLATGRRTVMLWILLVPAALFIASQYYLVTLTGSSFADGCIGVLLGLYMCSHPAANAIDLLFFERAAVRQMVRSRQGIGWLLLNAFVMLIGWFVIVIGAARFTGRAGEVGVESLRAADASWLRAQRSILPSLLHEPSALASSLSTSVTDPPSP